MLNFFEECSIPRILSLLRRNSFYHSLTTIQNCYKSMRLSRILVLTPFGFFNFSQEKFLKTGNFSTRVKALVFRNISVEKVEAFQEINLRCYVVSSDDQNIRMSE